MWKFVLGVLFIFSLILITLATFFGLTQPDITGWSSFWVGFCGTILLIVSVATINDKFG